METIDQLKKIFGLEAAATDAQLMAAAQNSAAISAEHLRVEEEASIVNQLIIESGNALTQKTARSVIANRGGFAAMKRNKKS